MPIRDDIGKIRRSAPKVGDPKLQRAIDTIYKDLNKVADGTNSPAGLSAKTQGLGTSGDIKLYKGAGLDGKSGYFLQARFADGWATTRLTLEAKNPEATEVIGSSQGDADDGGPEPYITKYGVTYTNLQFNQDVAGIFGDGTLDGTVARGNHKHYHWDLQDPGVEHLNDIHYKLVTADIGTIITNVGDVPSNTGVLDTAARADHIHKLDTLPDYVWYGDNKFGNSYGAEGVTTYFNGPLQNEEETSLAMKIQGDVELDGNLSVYYSETQSSAVDLANHVAMNTDNLNSAGTQLEDYNMKTIVHGPTKFEAGLSVKRDIVGDDYAYHYDAEDQVQHTPPVIFQENSAGGQLRLAYDSDYYLDLKVDASGSLIFETIGNIELKPLIGSSTGGAVIPKGNLVSDLGMDNRKWRSIHAGELIIDHLVAQNVVSTIGGKIMVAPTSELAEDLDEATTDYIYLKHNDPNFRNAYVLLEKWTGSTSQVEAIRIKDVAPVEIVADEKYKYEIHTRNSNDDGGANDWLIGDAVACLYALGAGSNKGFIELTATGSVFSSSGPRISMYAAEVGDTAWDSADPMFSVGKIKGFAGYTGDDDFGMAMGDDLELSNIFMKGMTLDKDKGLRLWNSPLQIYDSGGTKTVEINTDGTLRLGSSLQPADVETKADWNVGGSNVGLVWDGETLYISGVINAWGDILQAELDDLTEADANLEDLINDIENLDAFSNYQAAETISQEWPGNIFLDSNFEQEGNTDDGGTYTDMVLWNSGSHVTEWQKAKSPEITPLNGTYVMRGGSVESETHSAAVRYNTTLEGDIRTFPVVPGMKFSAKYWYYIPSSTWADGPPNGTMAIGFKVYDYSMNFYTWKTFAASANATNAWTEAEGTYTIPDVMTWYQTGEGGEALAGKPTWIQPYLVVDEHNAAQNSGSPATLYCYWDQVYMDMDSSMAMPANPTGYPGFFGGSDAFGIHDGNEWRTFFGLNAGNSVMKLTGKDDTDQYVDQVTWDGSVFDIGGKIQLTASTGDLKLEGDIKIGDEGSIYSNAGGYAQTGIFLGHTKTGSTSYPKFSLVTAGNDTPQFVYDSEAQILEMANVNIYGKNVTFQLDNLDMDFFVKRNVPDLGASSHDDIIIGSWQDQTNSAVEGEGILVKHAENDYTKIYAGDATSLGGINRRGYDFPILIYDNFVVGGPIGNGVMGHDPDLGWEHRQGTRGVWPAHIFGYNISAGQPGGWGGHSPGYFDVSFPYDASGSNFTYNQSTRFWHYDHTVVPEGRMLVWDFQVLASHEGSHNGGNDDITKINWRMGTGSTSNADGSRGRDFTCIHNSQVDSLAGFQTYSYSSWNASFKHHFGYRSGGCASGAAGHTDKWCYHGLFTTWPWFTDLDPNCIISHGEIAAGTDVTELSLVSGYDVNNDDNDTTINSGVNIGRLRMWETNAHDNIDVAAGSSTIQNLNRQDAS